MMAENEEAIRSFGYWKERGDAPLNADEASFIAGFESATLLQSVNARVRYSYPGSNKAWFHFSGPSKELLDIFALSICDKWPMHWLTVEWTDWKDGKLLARRISVAEPAPPEPPQ
jgi:hypothetical protein